jgi:hypothetical protein
MSYIHHSYPFGGHAAMPMDQPIVCGPSMHYPSVATPMDAYLYLHSQFDPTEFYRQLPMLDDYDDHSENTSRPRLTKDQVDTLEAQFQAHPKPNSNIKRQLAVQTNLSLPRVANWFQNRRAKAKQQRRQQEFERMQREAREKSGPIISTDQNQSDVDVFDDAQDTPENMSLTPTQTTATSLSNDHLGTPTSSPRPRHQKTNSEAAREATFASLQRALNAAVAAREQFVHEADENIEIEQADLLLPLRSSTMLQAVNGPQRTSTFSDWGSGRDSSNAWTPSQSPEDTFEFGSLNAVPFASADDSVVASPLESPNEQDSTVDTDTLSSVHFSQQPSSWNEPLPEEMHGRPDRPTGSETPYAPLKFPFPFPTASRRASSSEELADTLRNVGIDPVQPTPRHLPQLPHRMDGPGWRRPEKELDLAARRKRPRPAAIGTSGAATRSLMGPSSMSPTTRIPSFSSAHALRHAKSSHSLGSRFAGVRKLSAAPRSPLGFSTFADAAAAHSVNLEAKRRLLSSTSGGNLAPPTPLTPEDLQHLLPPVGPDDQYQLSAHQSEDGHFLSVTQPMQVKVDSPPDTPLMTNLLSHLSYHNVNPPQSAPAHYTTFPTKFSDYSPCSNGPLTGVSWADMETVPSPENSSYQTIHLSPPSDLSTVVYEQSTDEHSPTASNNWPLSDSPQSFECVTTDLDSTAPAAVNGDQKVTEFFIHEFPEQQEAHRSVAQQLPPQGPKNYTFTNQTPNDF